MSLSPTSAAAAPIRRDGRQLLQANSVELCVQTFGHVGDPGVLLISGASTSMEMWPEELCDRLAATGHLVVRYDLRDTGESTTVEPGAASYTIDDLVDDAVALLDHLTLEQAHVIGMSMGGVIAQLVALSAPTRVSRLTLVSTTPAVPADAERNLPGMSSADLERFAAVSEPHWDDQDSVLDYLVNSERACAARSVPFDSDSVRQGMTAMFARSINPAAAANHFSLQEKHDNPQRLTQISVPTVVLHGDEDPVFPLAHGQALAREIPDAELIVLPHVGHEVPMRMWTALETAVRSVE